MARHQAQMRMAPDQKRMPGKRAAIGTYIQYRADGTQSPENDRTHGQYTMRIRDLTRAERTYKHAPSMPRQTYPDRGPLGMLHRLHHDSVSLNTRAVFRIRVCKP